MPTAPPQPHGQPLPPTRRPAPAPAPGPPASGRPPANRPPEVVQRRPEPSLDDIFATPPPRAPDRARSGGRAPRAPGTPYRGFRRPEPSAGGPSRLVLVAASLVGLLVLGAVAFGVRQVTSGGTGPADSISAAATPEEPVGATQPGESVGALGVATPSAKSLKKPVTGPTTGADAKVKLGVFLGTSPSDVRQFGNWLGREPDYALDFATRSTWSEISDPSYTINTWRGSDYRMVYSVPLLPWNGTTSIKAGSEGDYDQYFRRLAQNLVAGGQEDAILRLGWEFNLKGWKWSTKSTEDFIGYWRHVVTAMRSVPGQKLQFDWNPNIGDTPYEAHLYYPGGKYVDYVGVDVYDVSWDAETYPYGADCSATCREFRQEAVWDRLENGIYGLSYWADFARSKGKPMSIPEWGMWERPDGHGGGDNPFFVKKMHAFIDDPHNHVAYQAYLQVDVADGQHKLTTLKKAGKVYKQLFK